MRIRIILFALFGLLWSCGQQEELDKSLPIIGQREVVNGDTVYHKIPDFSFVNQDSNIVTNANFAGKAYVADFFFISCPTICPKVTQQMLRVHDTFQQEDRLRFLSHTVDPKRDTVGRLANYAENLGVGTPKWHFVTGEKDRIYEIADDYFSVAMEDEDAPGGFNHSGLLILVDPNRHVRAFCAGTDPDEVTTFIEEIQLLLQEMEEGEQLSER